jgi:PKD repeat protein
LGGFTCAYGLPGFPEDIFAANSPSLPQNQIASDDTFLCEKFCINFFDSSTNNPTSWQWYFPGGNPSSSDLQNPAQICYDNPGTYDVTLITNNAFGIDTLTMAGFITVYPTPPFPVITQVGYTLTSSPSNSYQWQFNATDIPGATNQSYTVMQTGFYSVIVGDSNSCKNSASTYVLISGVDDVSDVNISIYPNPATNGLMVEFLPAGQAGLNGLALGEISISILNTLGQEIYSSQQSRSIGTTGWKKEIDVHDVVSGVYFIEILAESCSQNPAGGKSQNIFLIKKIIITH